MKEHTYTAWRLGRVEELLCSSLCHTARLAGLQQKRWGEHCGVLCRLVPVTETIVFWVDQRWMESTRGSLRVPECALLTHLLQAQRPNSCCSILGLGTCNFLLFLQNKTRLGAVATLAVYFLLSWAECYCLEILINHVCGYTIKCCVILRPEGGGSWR